MLYWFGIGLELLSACQGFSNVKKAFLDDTTITKSMQWLNDHAHFAMFDPLTHVGIPDNFMFFLATL